MAASLRRLGASKTSGSLEGGDSWLLLPKRLVRWEARKKQTKKHKSIPRFYKNTDGKDVLLKALTSCEQRRTTNILLVW